MPFSSWITRVSGTVALLLLPAFVLAQGPPRSPEPPLDPTPETRAPRGDRLPPLDPPAPDDISPPRQPLRSQPRQITPTLPPEAEELLSDPGPQTIEMPRRGEIIEQDEVVTSGPVVVTPAPTAVVPPSVVWINGHFERKPDTAEYVPGRWEKPLIGAPRYIAPHYVTRRGRIAWVEGHWAQAATPVPATVVARPVPVTAPAPVVVARPVPTPVATRPVTVVDPGVRVVQSQAVVRPAPVVVQPQPVTVVTPAAVVTQPSPSVIVPGQWKRGLFGNWRYVPGKVVY